MTAAHSNSFMDRLRLECPVVQAGMAGGVAGGELAGAVSAAGGMGTVGMMAPRAFAQALGAAHRRAPRRPVAANLLLPFIRRAHVSACVEGNAELVVIHGGDSPRWVERLRKRDLTVFVTVGSAPQAIRALAAGAHGLVVQGSEAGGHLLGIEPIEQALAKVLEVAGVAPVLAAGGVAEAQDVRRLLDIGAAAAIAGTRFLLTEESGAHAAYKRRVLGAERTLVTLLFGIGWPMRHRVIANVATERWCQASDLGPRTARLAGRLSAPLGRALPLGLLGRMITLQRAGLPLFTPALPLVGMPDDSVERSALYAGESASRLHEVIPAAQALAALVPT
ncbi:MAG: NAD(P)H-dependent flavin oxidoreductase [Solirubrobacteraceae bacterium]